MIRIAFFLGISIFTIHPIWSQVIMKVVATDSTQTAVDQEPQVQTTGILNDLNFQGFSFGLGGRRFREPPKPIRYENIAFKIKRYSKLKTFEIILLEFSTLKKSAEWYKNYPELDHLRKYRLIYEGNKVKEHKALLDSISKQTTKERKRLFELFRMRGLRYSPRKFKPSPVPLISDIYLEHNEGSDNFLLNMVYKGKKISFPVGLLLKSTSAKKIQNTYGKFYQTYVQELEQRRLEWEQLEKEYNTYLGEFPITPLNADYLTEEGDTIEPFLICVLNYTNRTYAAFRRIEDVYYDPPAENAIVLIDVESNIRIVTDTDFQEAPEIGDKKQLVFSLEPYSEDSLEEILKLNQ